MQNKPIDSRVLALVQAAQQFAAKDDLDEAARLWEQVLLLAPEHALALFRLGQLRFYRKDYGSAQALLERAERADAKNPLIPLTLAGLHEACGDDEQQAPAIERALALDPGCYPALLMRGALLEKRRHHREAARIYARALASIPAGQSLSNDLQARVARARALVSANAEQFHEHLDKTLAAARSKWNAREIARFDRCVDVAAGKKRVYTQRPAVFHYPELPAIQFYDNALFPWIEALEAQTPVIREEFLKVHREQKDEFAPYVEKGPGERVNQWSELNYSSRWSSLHFWRHGSPFRRTLDLCPLTAKAIDAVPKIEIPGFTPTALYSVLAPHTRIPPHTSSSNIRLIVHLPLIVPEGCGFRVGNETRQWEVGKAWVFDDTIEHEAWNDSDELRAILMIDVWNPYLTATEREFCTILHAGISSYYGPGEDQSPG